MSLPKILSSSFQKLSYEKAKDIVTNTGLSLKTSTGDFSEHDLIKIVNICKKTKFQNPNTDHLSPIGREVLTIGMMSEYTIVSNKGNDNTGVTTTVEKPVLNNPDPTPQGTDDTATASTFESIQNEKPTPTDQQEHQHHSKIIYQNQIFQLKSLSLSLLLIHQEHVS